MIDEYVKRLRALEDEFVLSIRQVDDERIALEAGGLGEELTVRVDGGTSAILEGPGWHEHVDGPEELVELASGLFSGALLVRVTYRGGTAAGHRVLREIDGDLASVSVTGSLFTPFWRKKSCRTLSYRLPTSASAASR